MYEDEEELERKEQQKKQIKEQTKNQVTNEVKQRAKNEVRQRIEPKIKDKIGGITKNVQSATNPITNSSIPKPGATTRSIGTAAGKGATSTAAGTVTAAGTTTAATTAATGTAAAGTAGAAGTAAVAGTPVGWIILAVLAGIVVIFLIIFAYFVISSEVEDGISKEVSDSINDYAIIGKDGIQFDEEGLKKAIEESLSSGQHDLDDLGLGTDPNVQQEYLVNFMKASIITELPYIEGSDDEAKGIVHFLRDLNNDGQMNEELEYMYYDDFKKFAEIDVLSNGDVEKKEKAKRYYSLVVDDNGVWQLCIYKEFKVTENGVVIQYELTEQRIPYRALISQYGMPFEFLIALQLTSQNAEYVSAVADLVRNDGSDSENSDSRIDLAIFDDTTTDTYIYKYKANRYTRTKNIGYQYDTVVHDVEDKTETITEVGTIKANVTNVKTWIMQQTTEYNMNTNTEYPYGEEGKTETAATKDTLRDDDPITEGEGSWDINKSEYFFEKIVTKQWEKGVTETKLKPSKFMGLWRNDVGVYVPGARFNPNGKDVFYPLPGQDEAHDAPITNIKTGVDVVCELYLKYPHTQFHSELMRELVQKYVNKEEVEDYDSNGIDLGQFDPIEYSPIDWDTGGGYGFWWPIGGSMQNPEAESSYKTISSYFGKRVHPISKKEKMHNGIDIPVPEGHPIIAAEDGTVIIASFSVSAGNWVRIYHGNGIVTEYMHNSKLNVSVGQQVKKGQIIALAGSTGASTGNHCHFGVRVDETAVNPLDYVSPDDQRRKKNPATSITEDEFELFKALVFCEAGGESYEGQVAVAAVVLNRVRDDSGIFPDDITGVISQSGQFEPFPDKVYNTTSDQKKKVASAVSAALEGNDPTSGALYFFNPEILRKRNPNHWMLQVPKDKYMEIGNHRFFKETK